MGKCACLYIICKNVPVHPVNQLERNFYALHQHVMVTVYCVPAIGSQGCGHVNPNEQLPCVLVVGVPRKLVRFPAHLVCKIQNACVYRYSLSLIGRLTAYLSVSSMSVSIGSEYPSFQVFLRITPTAQCWDFSSYRLSQA